MATSIQPSVEFCKRQAWEALAMARRMRLLNLPVDQRNCLEACARLRQYVQWRNQQTEK